MADTVMSTDELIRARTTLGFSADTLAADLGLPPSIESGGLPECAWVGLLYRVARYLWDQRKANRTA